LEKHNKPEYDMAMSSETNSALEEYFVKFIDISRKILGDQLIGIYLQGSGSQSDFRQGKSDLDLVIVVGDPISDSTKKEVVNTLDHSTLSVPASGLDLLIVTVAVVTKPSTSPSHELWFSTGKEWKNEIDLEGNTAEHLIVFSLCRVFGKTLLGPEAKDLFAVIPSNLLKDALIGVLRWHQTKILDPFHDPRGEYSVLNACRAWRYAEEGILCSKSEGAEWALRKEPNNEMVRNALSIRKGVDATTPQQHMINEFLEKVIAILKEKMSI